MKISYIFIIFLFLNITILADSSYKKPNILIISICSLSKRHLDFYGYNRHTTPNITNFSKNSYIFKNCCTDVAWSNIKAAFIKTLPGGYDVYRKNPKIEFIKILGYKELKQPDIFIKEEKNFMPSTPIPKFFISFRAIDHAKPKYFKKRMKILKKLFLKKRDKPFLMEIHFKALHFPYCNINRKFYNYKEFLTDTTEKLFNSYCSIDKNNKISLNFKKHPYKLPVFGLLFNKTVKRTKHYKNIYDSKVKKFDMNKNFGYLWNKRLLKKWSLTKNFKTDVKLIKDIYDSKLKFLDSQLKDIINLFNDPNLKRNTIVIIMGDHGEAFMQHNNILHGGSVYEEEIEIPFLIKFPETISTKIIQKQFSILDLTSIIRVIMNNKLNNKNFSFKINSLASKDIRSRNLNNNIFSIRKYPYKYIYNTDIDKKELYNLKTDPFEKNNIYWDFPNISAEFEEKMFVYITSDKIQKYYTPKNNSK